MKSSALLATLAATMALAALPARAEEAPAPHGPILSLSAYGETHATPDMATISVGVTVQAPTAAAALHQNAERMGALITALKRQGVPDKDIQTSNLNLNPQYDYGGVSSSGGPPKLNGYQASNTVTVTVWETDKLGPIADAVTAAGANQISGIGFGLRDPQAAEDAARIEAVKRVEAKAALYAKATGHPIKRLRDLSEGAAETSSPIQPMRHMMAKSVAPTPVEAGQLDLRVEVQATYELEP